MMETEIMVDSGLKLTCSREDFVSRLAVVSRAVSTRSSVQILAGVLLRAEGGELHLAATDMELSLRTSLDAQVDVEGPVVVPGRLLVDLARLLPEPELQIEHRPDEGTVHITCGAASYRLHTYSAEDFPRLPDDRRDADLHGRCGSAARDRRAGVAVGVARRVASGADRHPRALRAGQARNGGHGLVSPGRQGDRPPGSTQELEAIIPARALTELARIAGDARARGRRPGEPGRVPRRATRC